MTWSQLARLWALPLGLLGFAGAPAAAATSDAEGPTAPECGAYAAPTSATTALAGPVAPTIFLNRCADGCEIVAAPQDDARANRSAIATRDSLVPPFSHADAVWNEIVACVADIYRPYAVQITDVDPGNAAHHEAIVAGVSSDIGLEGGMGGIAIIPCQPRNNLISFTFANFYDGDPRTICEIVAHETAHAFGLDHVLSCRDPLSYLPSCGLRYFRDAASACGESESAPTACECGGSSSNTHQTLLDLFGPGQPTPDPALQILLPEDGETVPLGFSIYAEAYSDRGLGGVELWLNGTLTTTLRYQRNNRRYIFETADFPVADGVIDIEVRAADDLGQRSAASITVTKGAPCMADSDCLDEQRCSEGRCLHIASQAALGESCELGVNCQSGICETYADESRCTEYCDPNDDAPCGAGFECLATGEGGLCWPQSPPGETGGCCQIGAGSPDLGGLIVLLAWLLGSRRRRCRRPRPARGA